MEKTTQELREELKKLLNNIIQSGSSFEVANLSRKALDTVEEIKAIKEKEKAQELEIKPETKPLKFEEIEFEIPGSAELIIREILHQKKDIIPFKKYLIRFTNPLFFQGYGYVRDFCLDILKKLIETDSYGEKITLEAMIEILEKNCGLEPLIEILEKKGLQVRDCPNCKKYPPDSPLCNKSSKTCYNWTEWEPKISNKEK